MPGITGLLTLDGVELPDDAEVYLCGNDGFVQAVREQLTAVGRAEPGALRAVQPERLAAV